MSIQVTCPSCHKRFSVSDKFGGKSGPCPNCKTIIRVPDKSEEIQIHEDDGFGPKDAAGRPVLKPIEREETVVSPLGIVLTMAAVILTLIAALVLRQTYPQGTTPSALRIAGAILLGPLLAFAGYWFLRSEDLEPHRGLPLVVRSTICGLVYAALWGVYLLMKQFWFGGHPPEVFHFAWLAPVLLGAGGVASLAALDMEFGNGAINYAFYLAVTLGFCFLLGIPLY